MRRRLWGYVILLIVFCCSLLSSAVAFSAAALAPDGLADMTLEAENDYLALYMRESTTEIAVLDKSTGEIFYSNPPGQDKREQVSIMFTDSNDRENLMNSAADSVAYGQYSIRPIKNGVRIDYTLGQVWNQADYIPNMISRQRMEEVLSKLDPSKRDELLSYFTLLSLRKLDGKTRVQLSGVDLDAILGDYTVVSLTGEQKTADLARYQQELADLEGAEDTQEVKDRRTQLNNLIKGLKTEVSKLPNEATLIRNLLQFYVDHRRDVEIFADVKPEYLEQMRDGAVYIYNGASRWREADVIAMFKSAGYTPEDKQRDHIANHIDPPARNPKVFNIPVEYVLEGATLVARVVCSELKYPLDTPISFLKNGNELVIDESGLPVYDENGSTVSYPLVWIRLLEHFNGAVNQDDGYLFIADGSGAIISLKGTSTVQYSKVPVYGRDESMGPVYPLPSRTEQAYLPVFGVKEQNRGMLAIIEDGESFADIIAKTSGGRDKFNEVYAQFTLVPRLVVALLTGPRVPRAVATNSSYRTSITAYQPASYSGDLQIRYIFLNKEDSDYVGMARYYRDYLIRTAGLKPIQSEQQLPFFLEVVGAISKVKPVLGVPRSVTYPLTTAAQAGEIAGMLTSAGVGNVKLRFTGWMAGGLFGILPDKVRAEGTVGSMKDLQSLRDSLVKSGGDLYLDVGFLNVAEGQLTKKAASSLAARGLDRRPVLIYNYNPAALMPSGVNTQYIIKPGQLGRIVDSFLSDFKRYGIPGLSLDQMGSQVDSDFDLTDKVDREQSVDILREQLQKMASGAGLDLMAEGGNAYILPYVDSLVDAPMDSSHYLSESETVPFFQIALHGLVNFAGEPINMGQDYKKNLLRTVETGGCPYFLWSYAPSSDVKESDFAYLYSTYYKDWIDEAIRIYSEMSVALGGLQGQAIVGHEKIAEGVYKTTYEGGRSVVVNYNPKSVEVDGVRIDGESFKLI